MPKDQDITTFREAAEALGLTPNSIGPLVKALNIEPKRVPRSGPAKGLNPDDMEVLRKALSAGKVSKRACKNSVELSVSHS
jgi:hypothetical protein